jgi:hypothetical protein
MKLSKVVYLFAILMACGCSSPATHTESEMDLKFYRVTSIELWGDYGNILVNGMTGHLGEKDGHLQLERAGPFIPPITFPGLSDLVVTDELRQKLETSELGDFQFRSVVKARIVDLPWDSFDRNSEDPPMYPDTGEPEDYILSRPHSPPIADLLGDIWQVALRDGAFVDTELQRSPWDYDVRVHTASWNGDHLFYGKKPDAFFGRWIIVSEKGRSWLELHAGDWVRFEALPVK